MLAHDFPFDTVQMPLNCFDATFRSFETHVFATGTRRGIAVLGMKVWAAVGNGSTRRCNGSAGITLCHEFAVATTISGIDSMESSRSEPCCRHAFSNHHELPN